MTPIRRAPPLLRLILVALIVGVPLLGAWFAGRPLAPYLHFPPIAPARAPSEFGWRYFGAILALVLLLPAPPLRRVLRAAAVVPAPPRAGRRLPRWGWVGLALVATFWTLAWTRFSWLGPLQRYTFFPLWLGYIVCINALTAKRAGRSMLTHRTAYLLRLFPLSALFWWCFEYLNRFVQNWHYVGIVRFGPLEYVVFATLSFATVLPAVLCTWEWLATFPQLSAGLDDWWRLRPRSPKLLATAALLAGASGLGGLALWPQYLFPLVWVAPLLLIVALDALAGRPTVLADLAHGDWSRIWLAALAALFCGFFWELWNYGSMPHWTYTVPYVGRFHLFEMPILGYAGYLPFGITCLAAADFFLLPRTVVALAPGAGSRTNARAASAAGRTRRCAPAGD